MIVLSSLPHFWLVQDLKGPGGGRQGASRSGNFAEAFAGMVELVKAGQGAGNFCLHRHTKVRLEYFQPVKVSLAALELVEAFPKQRSEYQGRFAWP